MNPGAMMMTGIDGLKSLTLTFKSHGPLTDEEMDRLYALLGKRFTVDGLERALADDE